MKTALLLIALTAMRVLGCQEVQGEYIHGSDLAEASPVFAALDPATEIALSPLPGIKRVFHSGDLLRIARSHGIEIAAPPPEICFETRGNASRAPSHAAAAPPALVHRGDKVSVTVSAGEVILKFDSEAESSGRRGDTVIIRNPESGTHFVARVEDYGKVTVKK